MVWGRYRHDWGRCPTKRKEVPQPVPTILGRASTSPERPAGVAARRLRATAGGSLGTRASLQVFGTSRDGGYLVVNSNAIPYDPFWWRQPPAIMPGSPDIIPDNAHRPPILCPMRPMPMEWPNVSINPPPR